jgi:hypothetical protein
MGLYTIIFFVIWGILCGTLKFNDATEEKVQMYMTLFEFMESTVLRCIKHSKEDTWFA